MCGKSMSWGKGARGGERKGYYLRSCVCLFVCWVIWLSIFVLPLLHRPYVMCACFACMYADRHIFGGPNTAANTAVSNIECCSGCNPLQSIVGLCNCCRDCTIIRSFVVSGERLASFALWLMMRYPMHVVALCIIV